MKKTTMNPLEMQSLSGVYYTMLNNYAIAVKNSMESSCKSSGARIEEIERIIEI